ncbi:MAG: carbonic anhydrase [Bowdeniella nasicola]|nr:carbonic anhydrase [Bowdeniella nasicola]
MSATTMTPAKALNELRRGNERVCADRASHPRQGAQARRASTSGQSPHTCVFSCGDSRVSPELAFDQGVGDLFVVRNGGQVLTDGAAASIEFAHHVLGVSLIVVLGHEGCGAVGAARALNAGQPRDLPGNISQLTDAIRADLRAGDDGSPFPTVRAVAERVRALPSLAAPLAAGRLAVVGAGYYLASGEVRWLERLSSAAGSSE